MIINVSSLQITCSFSQHVGLCRKARAALYEQIIPPWYIMFGLVVSTHDPHYHA